MELSSQLMSRLNSPSFSESSVRSYLPSPVSVRSILGTVKSSSLKNFAFKSPLSRRPGFGVLIVTLAGTPAITLLNASPVAVIVLASTGFTTSKFIGVLGIGRPP